MQVALIFPNQHASRKHDREQGARMLSEPLARAVRIIDSAKSRVEHHGVSDGSWDHLRLDPSQFSSQCVASV